MAYNICSGASKCSISCASTNIENYISLWSVVRNSQFHTDQETNFDSKLITELCKLYDIKQTRTTPNHRQSDGLVERFNRIVVDTIALIAKDAQSTWDLRIGWALITIQLAAQLNPR